MMRRSFLQVCGMGALGLTSIGSRAYVVGSKAGAVPRGSARNLIMIQLEGAPSHVDTFDLKLGSWTPNDFEAANFGNLNMSAKLFPNLVNHTDKFSLLRCINGTESVHTRARYILDTCQSFNPSFAKEQPHIGSLIAYELEEQRQESHLLPTFLAFNTRVKSPGLLSSAYAGFPISAADGVAGLTHPDGEALFHQRYASLLALDTNRTKLAPTGAVITDHHAFYAGAERLLYQPELEGVFDVSEEDQARYGQTEVGLGCALAVQALAVDSGARFIQIAHGSWDAHQNIYNPADNGSIYAKCAELDPAVSSLLEDLASKPGTLGGTLLDETMVIVAGEFGRTPGGLNNADGRDHHPEAWSALVAGGGIVPNQVFGATNETGATITDRFWSQGHLITANDLIATAYSSLGIDWTKEIANTPSGRVYEYTPKYSGVAGYYTDIVEMFG